MAKFELPIFDAKTGKIEKTYTRAFMPVELYIRFQRFSEKILEDEKRYKTDAELFADLEPLFLDLFPDMTQEEYKSRTDVAAILSVYAGVLAKSTSVDSSKNK